MNGSGAVTIDTGTRRLVISSMAMARRPDQSGEFDGNKRIRPAGPCSPRNAGWLCRGQGLRRLARKRMVLVWGATTSTLDTERRGRVFISYLRAQKARSSEKRDGLAGVTHRFAGSGTWFGGNEARYP